MTTDMKITISRNYHSLPLARLRVLAALASITPNRRHPKAPRPANIEDARNVCGLSRRSFAAHLTNLERDGMIEQRTKDRVFLVPEVARDLSKIEKARDFWAARR